MGATRVAHVVGDLMYYHVASKLVIASTRSVTPPIPLGGNNAVTVTFEIAHFEDDVTVTIELSNDLQTWASGDNSGARTSVGSFTFNSTGIASRFVRLSVVGKGSVIDASVETKRL